MEGEPTLMGSPWNNKLSAGMIGSDPAAGPLGDATSPAAEGHLPREDQDSSLTTDVNADSLAAAAAFNSDASSVQRIQQNLQRLYGSLGHLGGHASRASLPDIQEDREVDLAQPAAAQGSFLRGGARVMSDEDLFLMDVPGGATAGAGPSSVAAGGPDQGMAGQLPGSAIGESRSLFIRGIDPSMGDDVIREYFECFGDIHSLYTVAKHRGYVIVTYHDIRAARLAQHTAHGQAWRGRQIFCQFSEDSGASATLLLVALDGGAALDNAFYVMSGFGELRDLRRDPARPNCCFAEFYDARHAAAALKGISGSQELRNRLLVIDAGPTMAPQAGMGGHGSTGGLEPALAASASAGTMHQPVGAHDLADISRNLSEISLESGASQVHLGGGQHGGGGGTADLLAGMTSGPRTGPAYPLRGIASTGSLALWPPQSHQGPQHVSMGSSPVGNAASWAPQGAASLQQDLLVVQQQAAAAAVLHQNAALLQQQQQHQQQAAAVQAALQQAMLTQHVAAAAALGLGAASAGNDPFRTLPRRGFSEPALGGRLARRPMDPAAEAERRAQQERLYGLDMVRIAAGEDKRTTLMIKNIPNKYTQKMLLALMEERFAGQVPFPFDFFYLPIDFKNRCNVGYAFINMTTPHAIPALVEEFHGRRWPKFNSEKVCRVAYARIQGKSALVQHFQNSSLLHEDKRCRPVLFKISGEVEIFPMAPTAGTGLGAVPGLPEGP